MSQKLFSTNIHQLLVTYKNHKFHIVIQEEDKNLTVLQINHTRKFKTSLDPFVLLKINRGDTYENE